MKTNASRNSSAVERALSNGQGSSRAAHAISIGFVAVLLVLAALGALGFDLLSAARAYVGAESLWTEGQKQAVRALHDYARRVDEADWQRYRDSIQVTLSYRSARELLANPKYETAEVIRHFVAGGNTEADAASMVRLHRGLNA